MKIKPKKAELAGIATAALVGAGVTFTGISPARAADGQLEEVVVTARKRQESIQDVPLAISVLTSRQIEQAGITGLEDIALRTPGIQYHKQASQRLGRINTSIRFRGMNVNTETPQFQLASLFLDGMYVMGSAASLGLEDVERIEVIKGPQAAYFGRNTFGGAINFITRNPGQDLAGKASLSAAEYGDYEASGSIEGPILGEKLSARLSLRRYHAGSQWRANDGGELGTENTRQVALTLFSQPTDALTIRLRGSYLEDDDGPAAGGFIAGNLFDTCSNPTNPASFPRRYICGRVPQPNDGFITRPNGQSVYILTQNTLLDGNRELIAAGRPTLLRDVYITRSLPNASNDGALSLDGYGLRRTSRRLGLQVDYEFGNGMRLSFAGSDSRERVNFLRDLDVTDVGSWWESDPRDLNDKSAELRLSSGESGSFRWMVGYNYYEQLFTGDGAAGLATNSCFLRFPPGLPPAASPPCAGGNLPGFPGVFVAGNGVREQRNLVETTGVFGGVTYDFNEQWSLSLEGRYLDDQVTRFNTTNTVAIPAINYVPRSSATQTFSEFLPRVILQFRPNPATNLYASYSKGILPGEINGRYAFGTSDERNQYIAAQPTLQDFTGPEKITAYEIGWKQELLDGRASVRTAYYNYPKWENQKGRVVTLLFETNPATGARNAQPNARNLVVTGNSKLQGLELEAAFQATENLELQFGAEWTDNEYENFFFNFVEPLAGTAQMRGNRAPRYPEYTANASANYSRMLGSGWQWFTRWDVDVQGDSYVDESNLAKLDGYTLLHARVGVERNGIRAELFARNLTDEQNWAAAARWTDFSILGNILGLTNSQGVLVSPQSKRQFGLRISAEF